MNAGPVAAVDRSTQIELRTFPGPNVFAPFAAVVAEFAIPPADERVEDATFPEVICAQLPDSVAARFRTQACGAAFEALVAGLAQALQDWHGPNDLPCEVNLTRSGRGLICLGYHDERATAQALRLGYQLALAVAFSDKGEPAAQARVVAELTQFGAAIKTRQPTEVEHAMILGARERAIPFYRVVPGLLQYGQGKYGRHFLGVSSQRDSATGSFVQANKTLSNALIQRLGLPGVEHGMADTLDNAVRLAGQFGYPLAVKSVDDPNGQGVTAQVTSEGELAAAFATANAVSPGRVVIERFVEGEDHRLEAICGKFVRGLLRSPPYSIANASAGGTWACVTETVHPDNRKMVETIARCFRLDTIRISFITPDIAKSWRDVRCAVTEVNSRPAITAIDEIRTIFEGTFDDTCTGRIPSAIVLSAQPAKVEEALPGLQRDGLIMGFVDRRSVSLGGEPRVVDHVRLAERVRAVLLDPTCEALVVACTPEEIIHQGLPLDRFDLCVIEPQTNLWERLRSLLNQCSKRIVENVPAEAALMRWLNDEIG